jgi:hypothetical protein
VELLLAMQLNPSASLSVWAQPSGQPIGDRGTTATARGARRGREGRDRAMEIEEGRTAPADAGRRAGPSAAVAELTAAAEPECDEPKPAEATRSLGWIRPLACYERRETTEVHGARYG